MIDAGVYRQNVLPLLLRLQIFPLELPKKVLYYFRQRCIRRWAYDGR